MVAQILAVTIFVAMFVLIVIDKIERQYITLGCGVITLVVVFGLCMHSVTAITDTLNIHSILPEHSGTQAVRQKSHQVVLTGRQLYLLPE